LISSVYLSGNTLSAKALSQRLFRPLRTANSNYHGHNYVKIYSLDICLLRR
jgi:hypothetical protein